MFAGAEDPDAQKRQRRKIQSKHRALDEKSLQVKDFRPRNTLPREEVEGRYQQSRASLDFALVTW